MPTIYDYLGRPRVSSERIRPRNQAGLDLEREIAAMGVLPPERLEGRPDLQEAAEPYRRSIHAAAVADRDPLARSNYRAKTAQAAMAPAFGAEYGQDAQAQADIASQHLYGSPAPKPGPVDKYLHGAGQMAREREDYGSGAFQGRMEQGDGGLAGLAAGAPDMAAEEEPVAVAGAGGMMGAVQPAPGRQRGWARPTASQMKQAERSRSIRQQQVAKRDEARQKQRNFRLQQQREQREAMGGFDPRMIGHMLGQRGGAAAVANLLGQRMRGETARDVEGGKDRRQDKTLADRIAARNAAKARQDAEHKHQTAMIKQRFDRMEDLATINNTIKSAIAEGHDAEAMSRLLVTIRARRAAELSKTDSWLNGADGQAAWAKFEAEVLTPLEEAMKAPPKEMSMGMRPAQ